MVIYCCNDHVDRALEGALDVADTPPEFNKLAEDKKLSTTCEFCSNPALYMVSNG